LLVRTPSVILCSLAIIAACATPALATAGPGGAIAEGGRSTSKGVGAAPKGTTPAIHTAPVTSRSSNIAYKGPVYQKTATGEVVPYQAPTPGAPPGSPTGQASSITGGSPVAAGATPVAVAVAAKPELLVPGSSVRYVGGLAAAPMSAPAVVQQIVWSANQIIGLPYVFGGGHASFDSPGYDCSGTVSFALHGGDLLATPEDSSEFMVWGSHGAGRWVTLFSNAGHAYMTVAGLRLDTSAADDPSNQQGPRWRPLRPANEGFIVRHPLGL
jgi:cell wall-associated NlpC family hydrolase